MHGHAHVLLQERDDGLVELARVVELHGRDAQPFGVDLGGVGGVRAGDPAADVGVVADRAGERQPLALVVERLHDEDVGQVHAAVEGIVHDEDVARRHVVAEVAHDRFHGGRHRAQVPRQRQALRGEPAVAVGEAGRVVHVVLQHRRVGGPEDGQRHLVGDREDGVLEQLERDRVGFGGHALHPTGARRQKQVGRRCSRCRRRARVSRRLELRGAAARSRQASTSRPRSGTGSTCWNSCCRKAALRLSWRSCFPARS